MATVRDLPTYEPIQRTKGRPATLALPEYHEKSRRVLSIRETLLDLGVTCHVKVDADGVIRGSLALSNPDRSTLADVSRVVERHDLAVSRPRPVESGYVTTFEEKVSDPQSVSLSNYRR